MGIIKQSLVVADAGVLIHLDEFWDEKISANAERGSDCERASDAEGTIEGD